MGNAIEPKHHGPDRQGYKDPSQRGKGGGGGQQLLYPNADTTPPPSTSCGAWPPNNRSLREYPIFAHFGVVSGLER